MLWCLLSVSSTCLGVPQLRAACADLGLDTPGNRVTDGKAIVEGEDWGYGFNLGALLTLSEALRIGASYRSENEVDMEGDANFENINLVFPVDLPASLALSALYQLTDSWILLGDMVWTD